jgi:hypothetical protein
MSVNGIDLTGKDMHDSLTGKTAADAASNAAAIQAQSGKDAIKSQEKALRTIRKDLAPFKDAGARQLPGLEGLINDPNQQLSFIQNNPFFNALAKQAEQSLFANQAARGKVGSGDTASGLQNALLLLGNDLVQQSIGDRFNIATMGQNAAAQTGTMTQNSTNSITDLITGIGNAGAAGQIGVANASAQGASNAMAIGGGLAKIFLSDRRMKCDLEKIGVHPAGIPIYSFRYVGGMQKVIGVMAQDVEKVVPGAVHHVFDVKFVDYAELGRVLH